MIHLKTSVLIYYIIIMKASTFLFVENLYSNQFDCEMKFHRSNIAVGVEGELEEGHKKEGGDKICSQQLKRKTAFT